MTDNEADRRFYRNMAAFHLFVTAAVTVAVTASLTGAWVMGRWHSGHLFVTTAATLLVSGQLLMAHARWRDYRREAPARDQDGRDGQQLL